MATITLTGVSPELHESLLSGATRTGMTLENFILDLLLVCLPNQAKSRDLTEILESIPPSDLSTDEIVAAIRAHRDGVL